MRPLALCGLMSVSAFTAGCGDTKKNEAAPKADQIPKQRATQAKAPEKKASPSPPPAPTGALTITDPPLFVQTCAKEHPCPSLLQAEGEQHCNKLTLGTAHGWRLPTREEVERMRGNEGLAELGGYHWTSTAFDQDESQVWIVDPTSDQPTTVPRDRKPFRIRCVKEP